MLRADSPDDYVIATGQTHTLESFVNEAFAFFGLDWRQHIDVDQALLRPIDIMHSAGNPDKARRVLEWEAKVFMKEVVSRLADGELRQRQAAPSGDR